MFAIRKAVFAIEFGGGSVFIGGEGDAREILFAYMFLYPLHQHRAVSAALKLRFYKHFFHKNLAVIPPNFFVRENCADNFVILFENKADKLFHLEKIGEIFFGFIPRPAALSHFVVINALQNIGAGGYILPHHFSDSHFIAFPLQIVFHLNIKRLVFGYDWVYLKFPQLPARE